MELDQKWLAITRLCDKWNGEKSLVDLSKRS